MTDSLPTDHHEPRDRLLDAAERLFGEHGFEATSVRDLTAEAGCNVAAVNYHFGGKDRLYLETFRRLLARLRDRRIASVAGALETAGGEATLELFLEAFAEAFLEPLREEGHGRRLMSFLDREMRDPHLPREVFLAEFIAPIMAFSSEALQRVAGPMPAVTARMCLMSLVGQLTHAIKAHQMMDCAGAAELVPGDLAEHVRHFVRFSSGGVRACLAAAGPVAETAR